MLLLLLLLLFLSIFLLVVSKVSINQNCFPPCSGHTQSWGLGIPDLLTECYENGSPADYTGPMDPTKEYVYSVLNTLFAELADVFPDDYVHLGGDEVDTSCW